MLGSDKFCLSFRENQNAKDFPKNRNGLYILANVQIAETEREEAAIR
jgi:hypothetical protein